MFQLQISDSRLENVVVMTEFFDCGVMVRISIGKGTVQSVEREVNQGC